MTVDCKVLYSIVTPRRTLEGIFSQQRTTREQFFQPRAHHPTESSARRHLQFTVQRVAKLKKAQHELLAKASMAEHQFLSISKDSMARHLIWCRLPDSYPGLDQYQGPKRSGYQNSSQGSST